MKTGICSVSFRKLSFEDVISLAKNAGLDGIEWGGDVHVPAGDVVLAKKVLNKTNDAGLEVLSYGSYYYLGDGSVEDKPNFDKILASAKALKVNVIRIWGGHKNAEVLTDDEYKALIDETRVIADLAKAEGIKIAFEFHNNTITNSCNSAIRFMEDVAHDNVGLYWQYSIEKSVEDNLADITRVLPYMVNVHVYHYNASMNQLLLDEDGGESRWARCIAPIAADNKDHNFFLEFTKGGLEENAIHDAKVLNSLVK